MAVTNYKTLSNDQLIQNLGVVLEQVHAIKRGLLQYPNEETFIKALPFMKQEADFRIPPGFYKNKFKTKPFAEVMENLKEPEDFDNEPIHGIFSEDPIINLDSNLDEEYKKHVDRIVFICHVQIIEGMRNSYITCREWMAARDLTTLIIELSQILDNMNLQPDSITCERVVWEQRKAEGRL